MHPLLQLHSSPAMHAFGKSLERAAATPHWTAVASSARGLQRSQSAAAAGSREQVGEIKSVTVDIGLPQGLDARGYKRQLRSLVEDTKVTPKP